MSQGPIDVNFYFRVLTMLYRLREAQRNGPAGAARLCEAEADDMLRAEGRPLPEVSQRALFDPGGCARRRHGPEGFCGA